MLVDCHAMKVWLLTVDIAGISQKQLPAVTPDAGCKSQHKQCSGRITVRAHAAGTPSPQQEHH